MENFHSESTDRLFHAILSLGSVEECYDFFEDICTINEIKDMSQRLDTAVLLDQGANYQTISETVGVSTATISRVNRCLRYGTGGYRLTLNRLSENGGGEKK